MTINSHKLFQFIKYVVYALLAFNVFVFWREEFLAAVLQFPAGVEISHIIASFPATIDTAAWLILLLMFELETYVLDDEQYSPRVTWSLQGVRVFCYGFILYAFYGYLAKLGFIYDTAPLANVSQLCALVADGWSYAVDLDEYVALTATNCLALSDASAFFHFDAMPAVVDLPGLIDIRRLAWVDVINAGVWLMVVLVLEIDVRLQEKNHYEGLAFRLSYATKYVLYSLLLLAAIYWGFKGDFVDFWDAFLWLGAFVFIELNVFEWRQEVKDEQQNAAASPVS